MRCALPLPAMRFGGSDGYAVVPPVYSDPGIGICIDVFRLFPAEMTLSFFLKCLPAFGAFPQGRFLAVPFLQNNFDSIAKALADLPADLSGYADDIAGGAHLYDLSPVWNAVKSGVYQQTAFAKKFFDIIWDFYIGSIHISILKYRCAKL